MKLMTSPAINRSLMQLLLLLAGVAHSLPSPWQPPQQQQQPVAVQQLSELLLTVSELTLPGTTIAAVTDRIAGTAFTFKNTGGSAVPPELSIDANNGIISLKTGQSLDYENAARRSFAFVVVVANGTGNVEAPYRLLVSAANDESPRILKTWDKLPVQLRSSLYAQSATKDGSIVRPGGDMSSFQAVDPDANSAVTFALAPGTESLARGRFKMISNPGYLVTVGNDAFNNSDVFRIYVQAQDSNADRSSAIGWANRYGYASIVVNVNYQNPQLASDPTIIDFSESAAVGSIIGVLRCTSLNNIWSTVRLQATAMPTADFSLDPITGNLTLRRTMDFDDNAADKQWRFMFSCVENSTRTSAAMAIINLQDANDNRPYFDLDYYLPAAAVAEDLPLNATVMTVAAIDADTWPNKQLSYSLSGVNSSVFFVETDNVTQAAVIKLARPMDFDTLPLSTQWYEFILSVSDGVGSGSRQTATVLVPVSNRNDLAPTLTSGRVSLSKTAPAGTIVFQLQGQDGDGSDINYYFLNPSTNSVSANFPSSGAALFQIDASSGRVTVATSLTAVTTFEYNTTVVAVDSGTCPSGCPASGSVRRSDAAWLYISITDANLNAPVFRSCPTSAVSFAENPSVGAVVAGVDVTATDSDTGNNGRVAYSLVDNNLFKPAGYFRINSSNAQISYAGPLSLDKESSASLDIWITVRAADMASVSEPGSPDLSALCTFQLVLTDQNDNAPLFDSNEYDSSVLFTSGAGTEVIRIFAYDADEGNNAVVNYAIDTNPGNAFSLAKDATTGEGVVTLNRQYVTVLATDPLEAILVVRATNPVPLTGGAAWNTVRIRVQFTNNRELLSPVIAPTSYSLSVMEDARSSFSLLNLTATRPAGEQKLKWSIEHGSIAIANPSGNQNFRIRAFNSTTQSDIGLYVGKDSGYDFTITPYILLHIRCSPQETSAGFPVYSARRFRVTIVDTNNKIPLFLTASGGVTRAIITETFGASLSTVTPVTQVQAIDKDSVTSYKTVTYSLQPVNDHALFSIDGTTGQIRTRSGLSFDREVNARYSLTVLAQDGAESSLAGFAGGPNTATINIEIRLSDQNDNSPRFNSSSFDIGSVAENAAIGATIATVTATDADESPLLQYQITNGNVGNVFGVRFGTGEIFVARQLDYESAQRNYTLQYEVFDGVFRNQTVLSVRITNTNDYRPRFGSNILRLTNVSEVAAAGNIQPFMATSTDTGGVVTYTLAGELTASSSASPRFSIGLTTAMLSFTGSLDRSRILPGLDAFRFNVIASDRSLRGYLVVELVPTDVDNTAPKFMTQQLNVAVTENTPASTPFHTLAAYDPDVAALSFAKLPAAAGSNEAPEYVNVASNGQLSTTQVFDYESPPAKAVNGRFTFRAVASDSAGNAVTGTVTVSIVDASDNAPQFLTDQPSAITVSEAVSVNDTAFVAAVTDVDPVDRGQLTCSLSAASAYFRVVSIPDIDACAVIVTQQLDFDAGSAVRVHAVRVRVTDSGSRIAERTFTVNIAEANDNDPVIALASASVTVSESSAVDFQITTFTVTDVDSPDSSFGVFVDSSSDPTAAVKVALSSANSGQIQLAKQLDREAHTNESNVDPVLTFRLVATDPRGRSGTATLTVTVSDVNDSPPELAASYSPTVLAGSAAGTVLTPVQMMATDADRFTGSPPIAFTEHRPSTGHSWSTFELTTGSTADSPPKPYFSIVTRTALTADTARSHYLGVVVRDTRGGPSATVTVTVTIVQAGAPADLASVIDVAVYYNDTAYKGGVGIDIGSAAVLANDGYSAAEKEYSWLNQATAEAFFELRDKKFFVKSGTGAGNYTLSTRVTDPLGRSAVATQTVRVHALPWEAVNGATAFVITGMSASDFVQLALQQVRQILAQQLGTSQDKVVPLSVQDAAPNHWRSVSAKACIVYFAGYGSPFYTKAKMDYAAAASRARVAAVLSPLGGSVAEVPFSPCLRLGAGSGCTLGCTHELAINAGSYVSVGGNSTRLVGMSVARQAVCQCPGEPSSSSASAAQEQCPPSACLNEGVCIPQLRTNSYNCSCKSGFDGPRCQRLQVGFDASDGYLLADPLLAHCQQLHLSLHFLTASADAILLYAGPYGTTSAPAVPDYLSLQLRAGRPTAVVQLGAGAVTLTLPTSANNRQWRRVDFRLSTNGSDTSTAALVLDECRDAATPSVDGGAPLDMSSCYTQAVVQGVALNVGDWPTQIGGRINAAASTQYPSGLAQSGIVGQIAKVRINSQLLDLVADARTVHNGAKWYSNEVSASCASNSCGSGLCLGSVAGARPAACHCSPGWQRDVTTGACTVQSASTYCLAGSYLWWQLSAATLAAQQPRRSDCIGARFRTRQASGVLLRLQGADPYRPEQFVLRLRNSRLVAQINTGDYRLREATLPNLNLSDGGWHHARVCRSLQLNLEVSVDDGEGMNFARLWGSNSSAYNFIRLSPDVIGGATVSVDSTGLVTVQPAQDDLSLSCLQSPTIDDAALPVPGGSATTLATLGRSAGVEQNTCRDAGVSSTCPTGASCPNNQICIGGVGTTPICGCASGWTLYSGTCYANPCFPLNPCLNGGLCIPNGALRTCRCPSGFSGSDCSARPLVGVASAGLITVIVLCVIILLLVIAFFIMYLRCGRGSGEPLLEPDKDTRENVMTYDEEGAGEEDTRNFDLKLLRMPNGHAGNGQVVFDNPLGSSRAPAGVDLQPSDAAPPADGLEYTLDYGYEGACSEAGDLSSVCSADSDESQDYGDLHRWGPDFRPLADLYAQP